MTTTSKPIAIADDMLDKANGGYDARRLKIPGFRDADPLAGTKMSFDLTSGVEADGQIDG